MNSTNSNFPGAVSRSVLRGVAIVVVASLLSGPSTAGAQDIVLRWNEIAAATATTTSPFNQARVGAIVQLAVFEAVNAITGDYEPYLSPATTAPDGASVDAAVITAAHRTLVNFFSAATGTLNGFRDSDLANIPDGQSKTDGIAVGMAAANAMLALRAADGSAPLTTTVPALSTVAGVHQLTSNCTVAMFTNWRNVTPFGIEAASDFLLDPPPALDSNRYTMDYLEVKTVGANASAYRPADRSDVVRLYAATSPSFALMMAARQIAIAKGTSLSENARALALIQMATSDALVASFMNKYHYNFWRPETGIRGGATDGNDKTYSEPGFTPFIPTPCFPSYPSNHASGTGGGLEAMRRLFGAAGHDITITNTVPALGQLPSTTITKHYTQLKEIGDDVDDARVYGGIHWRFEQVAGGVLGRTIATEVVKNNLRQVHP